MNIIYRRVASALGGVNETWDIWGGFFNENVWFHSTEQMVDWLMCGHSPVSYPEGSVLDVFALGDSAFVSVEYKGKTILLYEFTLYKNNVCTHKHCHLLLEKLKEHARKYRYQL